MVAAEVAAEGAVEEVVAGARIVEVGVTIKKKTVAAMIGEEMTMVMLGGIMMMAKVGVDQVVEAEVVVVPEVAAVVEAVGVGIEILEKVLVLAVKTTTKKVRENS